MPCRADCCDRETLQQLIPEFLDNIPTDPFDGKPIRYRILPRGYVVYSIDVDGKDDGGKEPPAEKELKGSNRYDLERENG